MFKTHIGPVEDGGSIVYLRPETAQGIYVNYKNVHQSSREKMPFGIAQVGKAFRNEIVTKNFIFRTCEFEQMEMQYFVHPSEDEKWFAYWREQRLAYYAKLGIDMSKLRLHQHGPDELAHYAKDAYDIEFEFPMGWQELEGVHNRTDFDLKRHSEYSRQGPEYLDEATKERYIPYIIETSAGLTRSVLMVLCDAYDEEEVEGETRVVLRLHPKVAPVTLGVLPLMKKDGLAELAQKLAADLQEDFPRVLRPERRHRPPLPPPGRGRHALLRHRRLPDQRGPDRHAALPRLDGAGAHQDRGDRAAHPQGDRQLQAGRLMNGYDVLKERGFIQQCSDEAGLRRLFDEGPVSLYVGFDPTGSSLHVGHMVSLQAMANLQRAGHRPIALVGGGTARIGDPSGKTETRKMLSVETIGENAQAFKKQIAKFLDFSQALMVDNADWLAGLNYIDFLREIGRHFSVNRMLSFETYKMRLETGLTFIEFNYQLLQSYDYLELYRRHGCRLQMGGDDQWGNIVAGMELIRKVERGEAFALTTPLITTADGKKMGKTEKGAMYLDPSMVSPYEFYQYWINTADADVERFLLLYTFLPVEQVKDLTAAGARRSTRPRRPSPGRSPGPSTVKARRTRPATLRAPLSAAGRGRRSRASRRWLSRGPSSSGAST